MSKFRVGDVVQRVKGGASAHVTEGGTYTVTSVGIGFGGREIIGVGSDSYPAHWGEYFELCQPEPKCKCICAEDAKRILEAQGYTVTPPPEPKTGVVYIMEDVANPGTQIFARVVESKLPNHKVLAIVPWTEGDGL